MRKQREPLSEREAAERGPLGLKNTNSVEYAYQYCHLLKTLYEDAQTSREQFEHALATAEQYKIYEKIPRDQPYGSLENLLRAELDLAFNEDGTLGQLSHQIRQVVRWLWPNTQDLSPVVLWLRGYADELKERQERRTQSTS